MSPHQEAIAFASSYNFNNSSDFDANQTPSEAMGPATALTRRKPCNTQDTTLKATSTSLASRPSTRKRKLNPELRDRVETFLAKANPKSVSDASNGPSKRRKISNPKSSQRPAAARPSKTIAEVPKKMVGPIKAQEQNASGPVNTPKKNAGGTSLSKKTPEEKRSRVFRKKAPQSYFQKLERATTQRMIVLNRKRADQNDVPCEKLELVGSTGNVYEVTIGLEPKCTCPDFLKGNQCKHILYSLVTVLKAEGHLQYQLAFLSSELREIFANAPPFPTEVDSASDTSGKRKPVEGECPICYMDLEEQQNELVWCRASCGNNMHKTCFDQWVASQRGKQVRCVYCRANWEGDQEILSKVAQQGVVGEDGYLNVAHLTGQSTFRDVSTYNPYWVRRQYYGMGY